MKRALRVLEDHAVDDVADDDVARYSVVRVADEVVVDLMAKACGVDYAAATKDVEALTIGGVSIPVAGVQTLIRTKDDASVGRRRPQLSGGTPESHTRRAVSAGRVRGGYLPVGMGMRAGIS